MNHQDQILSHHIDQSVPGSPVYSIIETNQSTFSSNPLRYPEVSSSLINPLSNNICTSSATHHQTSTYIYHSKVNPANSFSFLATLKRSNKLCDILIHVENYSKSINAHRVVLAAFSPYFNAMFTFPCIEADQKEITLRDIDGLAFEAIIDFCYESRISINNFNVQAILQASYLLQVVELQNVACEYIKAHFEPTNCLGIMSFAESLGCAKLKKSSENYIFMNFLSVVESEEYLKLDSNQLARLISSDDLRVKCEEFVYHALMRWLNYNIEERRSQLPYLLQHIRMPLLSPKFLVGTVSSESLIKSDERCRELLDEAKNYLLLPQERSHMQGPRTKPRKLISDGEIMLAVGGWCCGDAIASTERCNPLNRLSTTKSEEGRYFSYHNSKTLSNYEWQVVAPMSTSRCGVGVAVIGDFLYAVGGHDGRSYLNSIERYDPYSNSWSSDLSKTFTCRTSGGVQVMNRCIYAIGGQDGLSCLDLVERYDPIIDLWTLVSPMSTPRLGLGVAVLDEIIYAVGGSNGYNPLSSVEMYDHRIGKWQHVASMISRRKHLGVTSHEGLIFACGGRDDNSEVSTVEFYDPRAASWSNLAPMLSKRSGVGLAVLDNHLVAVGGFDGKSYLKSVESYDFSSKRWHFRGHMNSRRLGGGVGVLHVSAVDLLPRFDTRENVNFNQKSNDANEKKNNFIGLDLAPSPSNLIREETASISDTSSFFTLSISQITLTSNQTALPVDSTSITTEQSFDEQSEISSGVVIPVTE